MDQNMTTDNTNKETGDQVVKLYFNPRKWSFNKACRDNTGNRSFITGPDGVLAEGYMIGDWSGKWTEIVSETLLLPQNTDCSFTFWLNGGENDRQDEVCRLDIIFNNDHEQRLTYNLNRNYIRPVKKLNGWELYEIPFRTQDNIYTDLKFVAQRAYMTILTAKEASAYEGLPDNPDPFEAERPQRHNLIFSDGFPTNSWYSTKSLEEARRIKNAESADSRNESHGNPVHTAASYARQLGVSAAAATKQIFDRIKQGRYVSAEDFKDNVENKGEIISGIVESAIQDLQRALQQITSEVQASAKIRQASAKIRLDAISASLDTLSSTCDMLEDFDVDCIADNIASEQGDEEEEDMEDILSDAADSISDIADELRDSIEEMADRLEEIRESLSV